jgi:hypothetical protein
MRVSPLRLFFLAMLTLALAGCSAAMPVITSEWRNPAYTASPFKRIMVGGVGGDTSVRRNFEDEFAAQLRAAGIDAVPSYRYISDDNIDEVKLKQAAQKAGSDALLFARVVQVEQKTQYGPGYYPYTSFGVFGPHVGASWYGLGGVPTVYRYNEYVSETTLYDLSKNEVVWTGTIKTTEPDNVHTAIKAYVETVMKKLEEQNIVRKRSGI